MQTGFVIGNTVLPYYGNHPHNDPGSNERAIELPIAGHFMRHCGIDDNFVEIGEVTPFYAAPEHKVIDLNPARQETIKANIFDVDLTGKNVLSISTVEHVGTSDYAVIGDVQKIDENGGWSAVKKIVDQANKYLITFPIGWNLNLDQLVKLNLEKDDFRVMVRIHKNNIWAEDGARRITYRYGYPFQHANAVCVVTNIPF